MIPPCDLMVLVGKSKYDKNGRISMIKEIADLLDMMEGDYVNFCVENGKVVLRKVTKQYPGGFDIEEEKIQERLLDYEQQNSDNLPDEYTDPEVARQMAEEQYAKDQEARKALKKEKGL